MNSFTRFSIAAAALLASPLAAHAAGAPRWTVDAAKSSLDFTGTQTGTKFHGTFKTFTADIAFSPDDLADSHIDVTVDLASASTGDSQRDTALPGKDWFDVAKSPQAVFTSNRITKTGANTYQAIGTLQLRGVTKPLTLPFTVTIAGDTAHATASADLLRTAFGVGQGPWQSGQWVALNVDVTIDLTATKMK
ncbi:MAG: YceI family protein [Proteobacteria bacterium]|nr:YceI family protein [Pseudomonadota bacterium]